MVRLGIDDQSVAAGHLHVSSLKLKVASNAQYYYLTGLTWCVHDRVLHAAVI